MFEAYSVVEALYYILKKIGKADKIKLTKLIYLADKYHLMKYGRTITGDKYYAMPQGPVGSLALDVLNKEGYSLTEEEINYSEKLIKSIDKYNYKAGEKDKVELKYLSDSDIEVLDKICAKFGWWSSWDLKEYTHKYPEWAKNEELLKSEVARRKKINTEELFSKIDNQIDIEDDHIEEVKRFFVGNYD